MILLINPKTTKSSELQSEYFREPNLGILYIVAVLDQHDIPVDILDLEQYHQLENSDLYSLLNRKFQAYSIFGLTTLTNNFNFIIQIIKIIKQLDSSNIVILGGPHASFLYKEILETNEMIDIICVGEAENSFLNLIQVLVKNSQFNHNESKLTKIKGLAFRNSHDKIIFTGYPNPTNIETLPLPARYKLSHDYHYYRVASVIINRGCPNQCSFCSRQNLFQKLRIRSIDSILNEIRDITKLQNYNYINFYDNINIDQKFFRNFCNMFLENQIKIPWGCELRVDSINEEDALLLRKSGCKLVATGIESANLEVLKKNFKFQDPRKVKKGISYLKQAGVSIQAYFVLGLPGETVDSVNQTLEYINQLPLNENDKINYFMATPYPGSRLWDEKDKFGIKIIENDFSKYDCEHIIFTTRNLNLKNLESLNNLVKHFEDQFNQQ